MNNKRIRIAITQGDTNGIGYELIFKAFANAEIFDLCTPIIYGSPKIATYHDDVLDLGAKFTIIKDASEARDGHLNLLTVFDDDVKRGARNTNGGVGQRRSACRRPCHRRLPARPFRCARHGSYRQ